MNQMYWKRLSEVANELGYREDDIVNPELKNEWLALALAGGMQLAGGLGLLDVEACVWPENKVTSGTVEVFGKVLAEGVLFTIRFLFDDPYVSMTRYLNLNKKRTPIAHVSAKLEPWGPCVPVAYDRLSQNIDGEIRFLNSYFYNRVSEAYLATLFSFPTEWIEQENNNE